MWYREELIAADNDYTTKTFDKMIGDSSERGEGGTPLKAGVMEKKDVVMSRKPGRPPKE
jgi:hypothetical protein